jgi:hypothetical protein
MWAFRDLSCPIKAADVVFPLEELEEACDVLSFLDVLLGKDVDSLEKS